MTTIEKKRAAHAGGLAAENLAAWVLRLKGYRILARRFKTPVGEVDIVARRGKTIVFVEVKGRRMMDLALDATTRSMRQRIERAAQYFLVSRPDLAALQTRFDLFAVQPPFRWRHLDNAWRPPT